jgi:hypothetical protein
MASRSNPATSQTIASAVLKGGGSGYLSEKGKVMAQIEFFEESTKSVIANVRAGDSVAIPGVDDQVYIPHSEQAGVYAHVKVTGRQFFYSLDGCLTMVRLPCEIVR